MVKLPIQGGDLATLRPGVQDCDRVLKAMVDFLYQSPLMLRRRTINI